MLVIGLSRPSRLLGSDWRKTTKLKIIICPASHVIQFFSESSNLITLRYLSTYIFVYILILNLCYSLYKLLNLPMNRKFHNDNQNMYLLLWPRVFHEQLEGLSNSTFRSSDVMGFVVICVPKEQSAASLAL